MMGPDTTLAGRYRLLSRLGSGGHGEVWRARDTLLDRVVAVKTVHAGLAGDPAFAARFHAEARSMATVEHPGVVSVFDYGIAEPPGGATPYLVMQYLDGEPLHLLLSRRGRLPAGTTMDLVAQAAEALQAAHDAGVVHRDVKPGNLMIRHDGTVVLTDFGIARTAAGLGLTATGIVLGTAAYCAPEQAEGAPASPAMDVYALGVVAYECLSGRPPFGGDSAVAVALKHLHEQPPPLPEDVPEQVAAVVVRALSKNPGDRWPNAAAFAAAARAAGEPSGAGPGPVGRAGARPGLVEPAAASAGGGVPAGDSSGLGDNGPASDPGREAGDPLGSDRQPTARPGRGRRPGSPPEADGEPTARPGRRPRRARPRLLAAGGGLAAVIIAGAATSWSLLSADPTPTTAQGGGAEDTRAAAERHLNPLIYVDPTKTPDPTTNTGDTPADAGKRTDPNPSAPEETPDPTTAPGVLVGGIVHIAALTSGQTASPGGTTPPGQATTP
ncbi:MAG TPA: serine/threonine-protein kinase, partial [Nonomuraea sp.]|nr:serine/threonine-protein kinase [Nonomuraea sp.]